MWPSRIRYALDYKYNTETAWADIDWFDRFVGPGPVLPTMETAFPGVPLMFGKLSQSVEGGGKRRVFAIGNYVKQRLLKPYHDWLMAILRRLPTDGTFCQEAPLVCLVGRKHVYSFDLSAATDRWPLTLLMALLSLGPTLAASVVQSALGFKTFTVSRPFVRRSTDVCFTAGQPLGYYASWPLFTLSHHWVVWMAAARVYPRRRFKDYAILGDDVVIADPMVAKEYTLLD